MDFHRHGLLTALGFAALTGNSALAIYRSRDDPRSVVFVAGAYASIALLFHFLRRLERGEEGGGGRTTTRAAVWLLTTLLTAMFASRVAPLMPPPVGFVVYSMAAGTAGTGFWALFLHRQQ
ncbi:uncharacterized protein LOC112890159 [Panicum hallii]|uniref:uncharacterized protein LOC112890159 n=1 Tax=Panicum hallii TaxID=206008 RepID=UPI000DF4CB6C|nr:uncharacterized protein LOC112890159 [Panicum hallii]XP_025812818.1 uncharacterized protein LOC112890159 [Panicum hallii]